MSTPLLAEGFNDNYFQVGYSTSNYKFTDTMTSVSGSAEFGNNYSISGEYFPFIAAWHFAANSINCDALGPAPHSIYCFIS